MGKCVGHAFRCTPTLRGSGRRVAVDFVAGSGAAGFFRGVFCIILFSSNADDLL